MADITTSIQGMIHEIRGQKVMLDRDLAELYQVETRYLNKAVKRNITRFPPDFMFQLTQTEWDNLMFHSGTSSLSPQDKGDNLRSQFVTSSLAPQDGEDNLKSQNVTSSWGGVRKMPHAFTEQGIAMLSGLLNSDIAIQVNIQIMRAFVQLRHYMLAKSNANEQIGELRTLLMLHIENTGNKFSGYDETIGQIVQALNNLIEKPPETKRIGFQR